MRTIYGSSQKGFTLIELIVTLSVISVLGILGIAGFVRYNQVQVLQAAASDITTTLNLAKTRSLSQVKLGSSCTSAQTLEGYQVDLSIQAKTYTLSIRCSGFLSQISSKTIPATISFRTPDTTSTSFFFPILTGGVVGAGNIVITDGKQDKIITIDSLGGISIK